MAMYTKAGNPVEIVELQPAGFVRCRLPMGGTRLFALSDLRADGGQPEIAAASAALAHAKKRLVIDCDICTEAPATRLARYHAGLLVCKECYAREPMPGNRGPEEDHHVGE